MFAKKFAAAVAAVLALSCFCACGEIPQNPEGNNPPKIEVKFEASDYENLPVVQFSSMQAVENSGSGKFKMQAPWTDTFKVTFSSKVIKQMAVFDESGKTLVASDSNFEVSLTKGQVVYVNATPAKTSVRFSVKGKDNPQPLPFDIGEAPDPASFSTTSEKPNVSPLEPATINYVKRKNTKYVYSNAPETLMQEVVNKCITRQEVSNESVFFTFEHQSREVQNTVWYGYRVTNTSETEDMYVTVKGVGLQMDGDGAYMGEKEWIDFYRTKFDLPDFSGLSAQELQYYKDYINFGGKYTVAEFQVSMISRMRFNSS